MKTLALVSPTLPTFLLFVFFYLFAYLLVFRNWGPINRPLASSYFISSVYAFLMAGYAIRNMPSKSNTTFASPTSALHNLVLEYSTSYFLVDLFHYLIFFPNDIVFILHHLSTLYMCFSHVVTWFIMEHM